MFQSHNGQKEL